MSKPLKIFLHIVHYRTFRRLQELSEVTHYDPRTEMGILKRFFFKSSVNLRTGINLTLIDYGEAFGNVT